MLTKWRAVVPGAVALLCLSLIAACGGDSDSTPTPGSPTPATSTPLPSPSATPTPTPVISDEPPERDLFDLARRFRGLPADTPLVARTEPLGYETGDSHTFTLLDLDGPSLYELSATVRAISDHAYFFIEDGTSYSESALQQIAADFENVVWPAVTEAFRVPATPGVDGDPRITLLHAGLRGAGGYVSRSDGFPQSIVPRSNEREMLYISTEVLSSPGTTYNDLVAHELQHLVHYAYDAGEEGWVNEGLSQVASQLVGGAMVWLPEFLSQPDLQLNAWAEDDDTIPHYAASEIFFAYLLDQYGGRDNAKVLVTEPGDGIDGVQAYLDAYDLDFDDIFAGWTIANWLDDADGVFSHPNLDASTSVSRSIATGQDGEATVHQYAADYFRAVPGEFRFDGGDTVSIGVPDHDGAYWWANRGDAIDTRLTRELDLRDTDEATLTFDTWYAIENGWDYAYVAVSQDSGATWTALPGNLTTTHDPVGASYGHGYTGRSDGWVSEEIDLSPYAGERILLRFEYVTDDSTNLPGFAVDNIKVTAAGLEDGADSTAGWHVEGFRRVSGPLEQTFLVQVVAADGTVTRPPLDAENVADITLDGPATIAIVALTRGTTEPAAYSWSLR